jgi:hypothetical protein
MTSVESHLLALTDASKLPGIQYIVVTSAGVLFEHTGGWADIPRRVPVDAATTMMAYSMSKTITAVAVLQLVETGRVGLDEPVSKGTSVRCSRTERLLRSGSSSPTRPVFRIQFRCDGFTRQNDMTPSTRMRRSQPY